MSIPTSEFTGQRYWEQREHRPLWSEERTEKFKALFESGLSFSAIAAELGDGLTRNACIGKAHRLGLHRGRPKPKPRPAIIPRYEIKATAATEAIKANPEKSNRLIALENGLSETTVRLARRTMNDPPAERSDDGRMKYRRRAEPRKADAPESIDGAIGFFDLQSTSCRWPVGEATGIKQLFCGQLQLHLCSYCEAHARKAYWCGPRLREAA